MLALSLTQPWATLVALGLWVVPDEINERLREYW